MKKLHPALAARAQAVKVAHATLTKTVPGFATLPPHDRIKAVQTHVKKQGGC